MEVDCESVSCSNGLVPGQPKEQEHINTYIVNTMHKHMSGNKCVQPSERTSSPLRWWDSYSVGFLLIIAVATRLLNLH